MPSEIDYYYTVASPWTYLGHSLFLAMAEYSGTRIIHKPVDIGAVFQVSGGVPVGQRPVQRQHYRMIELQRWRTHRNKPLNLKPRFFPVDANIGNRLVLAAIAAGHDVGKLAGGLLRAVWAEERNIADPATLTAIAEENGLDGRALLDAAEGTAIRAEYDRLTAEAKQREVFGAPTFIFRGEPFWGQDRLEFLERALNGETRPLSLEGAT